MSKGLKNATTWPDSLGKAVNWMAHVALSPTVLPGSYYTTVFSSFKGYFVSDEMSIDKGASE